MPSKQPTSIYLKHPKTTKALVKNAPKEGTPKEEKTKSPWLDMNITKEEK